MRKRVSLCLAVVGVLLLPGNFGPSTVGQELEVPAGLVGWWRFAEAGGSLAADSSGQGNGGTLVGSAFFDLDPMLGSALEVREASGGVKIPHDSSLEPPTGTIEAWVKVDSRQDSDVVVKVTRLMVRTNWSGWFAVYGLHLLKNGAVEGFVANDDPAVWGHWTYARSRTGLYKLHQWHHLALRWDGSTVAVFLDGQLRVATPYLPVPGTGLSYYGSTDFELAEGTVWGRHRITEHDFIGRLGDVRFYIRPLSDEEIYRDYSLFDQAASR